MKNKRKRADLFIWLLTILVLSILCVGVAISVVQAGNTHQALMPLVYYSPYQTPVPPTPTVTPTPTLTPTPGPGSWVYIGHAYNEGEFTKVYGVKASYCASVSEQKVVKRAWISSQLIPFEDCDRDGYNPAAPWPPPIFPPPPSLPPAFMYGDTFKIVLDYNAKTVCSVYYGVSNCVDVQ